MSLISKLADALFPLKLVCISCGKEAVVGDDELCDTCRGELERFVNAPPIKGIDGYTAGLIYRSSAARMIKRFKYSGMKYIAPYAAQYVSLPKEWEFDVIAPVPLYRKRLNERGFNQSSLIAKELCMIYNCTMDESLLKRVRDTEHQTRLTVSQRSENLAGAFSASDKCKGISVLIVDDVRTSGETLRACAAALRRKGCSKVYAATVCYANSKNV